ncbi:MAG: AAA family ATPase [Gammaproteobacteria bacterium]|nr:AAA family ATPase [Gammaproteobacteria bacterium]
MNIKHISINNYRGFSRLELDFQEKLMVFIGENGSGKTSILDCLAGLLTVFEKKLRNKKMDLRGIFDPLDIKNGASEYTQQICLLLNGKELTWKTVFPKEPRLNWPVNTYRDLNLFGKNIDVEEGGASGKSADIPLAVYYSLQNAPVHRFEFNDEKLQTNVLSAYDDALKGRAFDFNKFSKWYNWQENIERQMGENTILDRVRDAIYDILNDDGDNAKFSKLNIDWLSNPNGRLMIHKGKTALDINQLSSGEKTLLALAADLARRLAIANPHGDNPLDGDGIVLIDEIDLHLHPRWQRKVIPKLRKAFPRCQFIITTHSPLVLSEVRRENVVVLEDFKRIENTPHTFGRDGNSILYELMGVEERPKKIKQQLEQVDRLIDENKSKEAKALLKKLSKDMGENDMAIVSAYAELDFMSN